MFIQKENTGVWLIDVQEKLFPLIDRNNEVLKKICLFLEVSKVFQFPLLITEQYPEGLGPTIKPICDHLSKGIRIYPKTSFSGYLNDEIKKVIDPIDHWILMGIEAHICVLQAAKDLLVAKKNVILVCDAIGCRNPVDFFTAMEELRGSSARIATAETLIYELVRDASSHEFKKILPLIKEHA